MSRERYLIIENPGRRAIVDFLHEGCSVELSVGESKLEIVVKISHGEEASSWDEHRFEVPL